MAELESALRKAQVMGSGGGDGGDADAGMEMLEAELEVLREELAQAIEEKEAFCDAAADEVADLKLELEVTQEELIAMQSGEATGGGDSLVEMEAMTESLAEVRRWQSW